MSEEVADAVESPKIREEPAEKTDLNGNGNGATEEAAPAKNGHTRVPSSSSTTINTSRMGSATTLFIKVSLESIAANKEVVKKHQELLKACQSAIAKLNEAELPQNAAIFEPLKLACATEIVDVKITALDCLSKLFSFNIFDDPTEVVFHSKKKRAKYVPADTDMETGETPSATSDRIPLIDAAIETIADCFEGEGTDERVELQVIRVLMAAILNESMPAHGSTLLTAVRQIYNIFLLSLSATNQGIAQATLTQVVNIIFERVRMIRSKDKRNGLISASRTASVAEVSNTEAAPNLTLSNMENIAEDELKFAEIKSDNESEVAVKDAFLLFRAMSKLSVKVIENDALDMRSHAIRSKLLSLHILHLILKNHIDCFMDKGAVITSASTNTETTLLDAIRQYLCLTLASNATSVLAPVFEISLEIFWLMMFHLRSDFKREIPVFWTDIYFAVGEMKSSTPHQKRYLLSVIKRLSDSPRTLIEFYLNYDCDARMPNICESLVDYLTKLALTRVDVTPVQRISYRENLTRPLATYNLAQLPMLSISKLGGHPPNPDANLQFPVEYALKMNSIECLVSVLRSLANWADRNLHDDVSTIASKRARSHTNGSTIGTPDSPLASSASVSAAEKDTDQFETQKQRKTALLEGIRQFNFKPKRGIQKLVEEGFIPSDSPKDIAHFLLTTQGLDKAVIGEYLGEGDEKNIATMHAFVDEMDFTNTPFVLAMRTFLQAFRLPGEAQKIDRFMLKFAERYVNGNPTIFANADTAYVLAYSVIMLNTDQHSAQVRKRMTVDDFIKNNSGIDDGQNLPREFLVAIYEEIQHDEIKLQSEQHAALISGDLHPAQQQTGFFFGGRNFSREAYIQASREMSSKTEQKVRTMGKESKSVSTKLVYYSATNSAEHVRSMFETVWMSILAGLTPPFKEYDDDDTAKVLLEGIKISVHLACLFGLDYARTSFIGALVQFANLSNPEELKPKNISAMYVMLDVAVSEGHALKTSWKDVLVAISQMERLKLLATGVDSGAIPDVANARLANRDSVDSTRSQQQNGFFSVFAAIGGAKKTTLSEQAYLHHHNQKLSPEILPMITATDLDVAMDKVFSHSSDIVGDGINDFVQALTDVAWEEIESSGQSENPRMFSLQKMVDVCYYNMGRIRFQWSALWAVMGDKFNKFGCYSNIRVAFFALDSLRQLAQRFFELDELSHFKFQKEFLKPFRHIIAHNDDTAVKDMVLDCVQYLVQKRGDRVKSGWVTIFEILTDDAKFNNEPLVVKGYGSASEIARLHFDDIFQQGGFNSLVVCLTEFAKNQKFQKTSLQALQELKKLVKKVAEMENSEAVELWFPVLFSFHDVIMTGDDLEVRSRALNFLFDALVQYGGSFEPQFWDRVCNELLFPIFGVLSTHWEINQFDSQDDMSVWLSTTLIQALRNMVALFAHYFDTLNRMIDGYLTLLVSCICQENDTIARIGRSCLQQLITQNMHRFSQEHWDKICAAFGELFEHTTAKELFKADPLNSTDVSAVSSKPQQAPEAEQELDFSAEEMNGGVASPTVYQRQSAHEAEVLQKSKEKSTIVVKCVLQLLMIETLAELFEDEELYQTIPVENLVKLAGLLEKSYKFAREFNDDYNLRVRLWNAGIIERLPNLLKQETSAAAVYIAVMLKLYTDPAKAGEQQRANIAATLIPMCVGIVERYVALEDVTQLRNINGWRPVVVEILQGYVELDSADFAKNAPTMYDLALQMFDKSIAAELRTALKAFLTRVGDVYLGDKNA